MDGATYREFVARYMELFRPKVLSFDHYPLIGEDDMRPQYYENLEIIREAAVQADIPFWAFAMTTPLGPYREPTEAELRFQVFSNLVYGAQGIWYFCYKQPNPEKFRSGVVDRQERPTHHYARVKRINAILHAWGPVLLDLRSTAVYHVGELPQGTRGLPANGLVRSVTPAEPMIVGDFQHVDGGRYLMLMNRDWHHARAWRVTFASEISAVEQISRRDGSTGPPVSIGPNGLRLRIVAGGARLFRVLP